MRDHKNGWPIIAEHLRRHAFSQSDLARMLGISPSAITQLKQESYLLNFRQLSRLAEVLSLEESEHFELYRMIFRARRAGTVEEAPQEKLFAVSAGILTAYCPALEPLEQFLCRHAGAERMTCVRVCFGAEDPRDDAVIRVRDYPVPGDVVLAMLCSGDLAVRRFLRGTGGAVILRDEWQKNQTFYCAQDQINSRIFWFRPVIKIIQRTADPGGISAGNQ